MRHHHLKMRSSISDMNYHLNTTKVNFTEKLMKINQKLHPTCLICYKNDIYLAKLIQTLENNSDVLILSKYGDLAPIYQSDLSYSNVKIRGLCLDN